MPETLVTARKLVTRTGHIGGCVTARPVAALPHHAGCSAYGGTR